MRRPLKISPFSSNDIDSTKAFTSSWQSYWKIRHCLTQILLWFLECRWKWPWTGSARAICIFKLAALCCHLCTPPSSLPLLGRAKSISGPSSIDFMSRLFAVAVMIQNYLQDHRVGKACNGPCIFSYGLNFSLKKARNFIFLKFSERKLVQLLQTQWRIWDERRAA